MKKVLILTLMFLISACNHNIPKANLEFIKIEKDNKFDNYYNLYFTSDIEIIDRLKQSELSKARFNCVFNKNKLNYYLRASGDLTFISNKNSIYNYFIKVKFDKKTKDNSTYFFIKEDFSNILEMLNESEDCLSCTITAVTILNVTKRYVSNTMCLPKTKIIKVMKQ